MTPANTTTGMRPVRCPGCGASFLYTPDRMHVCLNNPTLMHLTKSEVAKALFRVERWWDREEKRQAKEGGGSGA